MTKVTSVTLAEVVVKLDDKLDEAVDFLEEMKQYKTDQRRFRHRLSAYLAAVDSVLDVMNAQGKRYAKQMNQKAGFEQWYEQQAKLFEVPNGTDKTWVYLRAARNDTVHVQQVDPSHLARADVALRLHISEGLSVIENREDEPVRVVDQSPKPAPPREPDEEVHIEKDLWAFQPVFNNRTGSTIEPPLHDDVVSIREAHTDMLRSLVHDCRNILFTLTPVTYTT